MNRKIRDLLQDVEDSHSEYKITRLWEHIFNRVVFNSDICTVSSQQPPTPVADDLRRVDLMVEMWNGTMPTRLLCLKAKCANPTAEELVTVEYQGFAAATAHCEYFNQIRVPVVTCAGGSLRIWIYERDDNYLTPWFPATGNGMGQINEYMPLACQQGNEIITRLRCLRDNGAPPTSTLPISCSPRPIDITLPLGWNRIPENHEPPEGWKWITPSVNGLPGAFSPGPTNITIPEDWSRVPATSKPLGGAQWNTASPVSEFQMASGPGAAAAYSQLGWNQIHIAAGQLGAGYRASAPQPAAVILASGSHAAANPQRDWNEIPVTPGRPSKEGRWSTASPPSGSPMACESCAQTVNPMTPILPVDVIPHDGFFKFYRPDGWRVDTDPRAWYRISIMLHEELVDCWLYTDMSSGTRYYARRLP